MHAILILTLFALQVPPTPRTVHVVDNIYTYEDYHSGEEKFTTTNMFVVTNDGVILADAQGSVAQTQGLIDAIAKVTPKPIKYVIIASDHGDHTAGNAAFPPDVKYIIHKNSKAILDAARNGWKPPEDRTEVIVDNTTIELGGERVDVKFLGRAHTGGDLAVWVPRHRVLFLSEIFLNHVFPAMRSAYPSEWMKAMDNSEAMKADIDIAGHGYTETDPAKSRRDLVEYHKALKTVIDEATRLYKAGVPVDEAIKQANWGEYKSWTLSSSQGPIAIRKVYEELSGKLK